LDGVAECPKRDGVRVVPGAELVEGAANQLAELLVAGRRRKKNYFAYL
jgi:hypothetical protein